MAQLKDVFNIRRGHNLDRAYLSPAVAPEGANFVSRTAENNGIIGRIYPPSGLTTGEPGEITVALGGSVLSAFLQDEQYVTAQNVAILAPKNPSMGRAEKLWWCAVIRANQYRYSYGRGANRTLPDLVVPDEAPAHIRAMGDEVPDVLGLTGEPASTGDKVALPSSEEWDAFKITDIFNIRRGGNISLVNAEPGTVPYISARTRENGRAGKCGLEPNGQAKDLTITRNGAPGWCSLQPDAFYGSSEVAILSPISPLSYESSLFLAAVLRQESIKYSYGRKINLARIKETVVRLPSTSGSPDWNLIDRYMSSLPWSKDSLPPRDY